MVSSKNMTYIGYRNHLKVCKVLGKPPVGDYGVLYGHITSIWEGMECSVADEGIYLHKGKVMYFRVDQDFKEMWTNQDTYTQVIGIFGDSFSWRVFYREMFSDVLSIESPPVLIIDFGEEISKWMLKSLFHEE